MKHSRSILLIDDDANLNRVLQQQLRDEGYEVDTALDGETGIALFANGKYDIVLSDLAMPKLNGMEVLRALRKKSSDVIFILMTAYGTVDDAITACRAGADDFITKPFGIEQLQFVIEKASRLRNLEQENIALRTQVQKETNLENLVGRSSVMQAAFQQIRKVAPSDVTVLILGESGTGKELTARALHALSPRQNKPFVPVDCAAIPENLIESELFGHVKGAFTGATSDRQGKFQQAHDGTLFLDEIGELKQEIQAKLLRVLQERQVEPVGSNRIIPVDVRIVASTNRDLKQSVADGQFRQDLYYRLAVMEISLPPLRERLEDIPALTDFFIKKYGGSQSWTVDETTYQLLSRHAWPGNIRELENVIQRSLVLSEPGRFSIDLSLQENLISGGMQSASDTTLESIETHAILEALQKENNNQTRAAKRLGIPRHVLIYRMKKWNIDMA